MDAAIIKAVRDHAKANYNKDGWDVLVECWDDAEIAEAAQGAKSAAKAITYVKKIVRRHDSIRRDVEGEIF